MSTTQKKPNKNKSKKPGEPPKSGLLPTPKPNSKNKTAPSKTSHNSYDIVTSLHVVIADLNNKLAEKDNELRLQSLKHLEGSGSNNNEKVTKSLNRKISELLKENSQLKEENKLKNEQILNLKEHYGLFPDLNDELYDTV